MSKKENIQILKDMKSCFESTNLPVKDSQPGSLNDFVSQIGDEEAIITVVARYDEKAKYACVNFSLNPPVPSSRIAGMIRLMNCLNSVLQFHRFSFCPFTKDLSLYGGIYLTGNQLPKSKFMDLVGNMHDDIFMYIPLMADFWMQGGSPEDLFYKFMDDMISKNSMPCKEKEPAKEEVKRIIEKDKILADVESVIASVWDLTIKDDNRDSRGLMFKIAHPKDASLFLSVGIEVFEPGSVVISITSPIIVPEEKMDMMMEWVNRFNRPAQSYHAFISRFKNKRIDFVKGIYLEKGILDKQEFRRAFSGLLIDSTKLYPVIKEQLASYEQPEATMNSYLPGWMNKSTRH